MGRNVTVNLTGVSMSVKSGKVFVIDEKQLMEIGSRIARACGGDLDKLEEYTSKAVSYLKKVKWGKGRNKGPDYRKVIAGVEAIYKKQKIKNLQKARAEYAASLEIKLIIGGKTKADKFIRNAQKAVFGDEKLKTWLSKLPK